MNSLEPPTAPLTLTLFGPMQVLVDGHPLPHLRSRKGVWIFALLALRHDRPVEREWLAAVFWPDMEPSQAFANLRPILSELRSGLGSQRERLQSPDRHTLRLDITDAFVDVLAFDTAIERGKSSDLERAVALYRGPLMEGCTEEWVFPERNMREHQCLQALDTLGNSALMAGDYGKAIGCYRRMVSIDPWWESARRGWMEALARNGDTNAALQVYREFMELLRSDPKASPDEQTTALYQSLRGEVRPQTASPRVIKTEATVAPKVAGYLPHPLTDLVGREDERLEVADRLRKFRLVTLTGLGGIGKTRLAIEVASEVVSEYADGVWLVALESLADGNLVVPQIALVLGVKETSGQTLHQSVEQHLQEKRLLLVLDNCEHLLEATAQIADHLLRECGGIRILATSREALGVTGEVVWTVPALAVPSPEHLPSGQATRLRVLMGFESVQLFVERAQGAQKSFVLTGANALAVAQICSRLEGIPLAIELAAARVKAITAEQIAQRLDDHLSLLTSGSRTAMSRQQTLRATLDWSYALLREPERRLLNRLSVFVGGWRLEAAEAVGTGETIPPAQILDLLMSLIDKSLVVAGVQQPEGDERYHLLEMVRQYAQENLQASGETEQVKRRHQKWFLTFAEHAEAALKTEEHDVWLARLEREHGNLRAALAWSLETRDAEGEAAEIQPSLPVPMRFCRALQQFWAIHMHVAEGRAWCERALQAAGAQERTLARARMLHGTGVLILLQSDCAASRTYFEESLAILREVGYAQGIVASLSTLGYVARFQGDHIAARNYYEQSLAISQEIGDSEGSLAAFSNLGDVAYEQGQFATAQVYYEKSQTLQRGVDDSHGIAGWQMGLGLVAYTRGDYPSARTYLEANLAINRQAGNPRGLADSLLNLGLVASAQGDYTWAKIYQEESLAIYRQIGDRSGIAFSFNTMGSVAYVNGDYTLAQEYHEKSLALCRKIGDRRGISSTLNHLGRIRCNRGDHAVAWGHYQESVTISQANGDLHGILISLEGFAVLIAAGALLPSTPIGTAGGGRKSDVRMGRAARIGGAALSLREQIGAVLPPFERDEYNRHMAQVRAVLGGAAFTAAWAEGSAMTWGQAVEFALAVTDLHAYVQLGREA